MQKFLDQQSYTPFDCGVGFFYVPLLCSNTTTFSFENLTSSLWFVRVRRWKRRKVVVVKRNLFKFVI